MNNKIRVVHLMTSFGGGISSFILNKAEALATSDIIFDVITFGEVSKRFDKAISNTGGKIIKISDPKQQGFRKFLNDLNRVFKRYPSETIIHSHFGMNLIVPFYYMAKKNGLKRFAVHAHTAAPGKYNKFKRKMNTFFADEKLSASKTSSANVFGANVLEKNQIVHIPNSINPEEYLQGFDQADLKEKLLGQDALNKKVIGHVGRFDRIKNHKFMIELIEELVENNYEFLWLFIGEGEIKNEIEGLVKSKNLEKYVKFLGRRDDMIQMYNLIDVLVLPSFQEGLPTVVIEAQAANTPSIISNSITTECDLDLNLVSFASLDNKKEWLDKIMQQEKINIPRNVRLQKLEDKKFTNDASAELYRSFLEGKVDYYNL